MRMCIDLYLRKDRHYRILDLGSRKVGAKHATHRSLLTEYDHEYVGADINAGPNVDLVMSKPYRIPAKSDSFDVVMTSQVFEHVAFPWVSFLEICRVVKPGGLIFVIAPSRGQRHGFVDAWRFYPDSMRAFAAIARVDLLEAYVDLPARLPNGRPNYQAIGSNWWGDAVGVFRKPRKYSKLVRLVRELNVWWGNRVGGVNHIKKPAVRPGRKQIGLRLAAPHQSPPPSATSQPGRGNG
jgi:SAM-dependent methyltransferase